MQNKLLISILAVLLVLRFVAVPLLDWQQERIDELTALQKRLDRSEALLNASEQVTQHAEQLKLQVTKAVNGLAVGVKQDEYQLAFQQDVRQRLAELGVSLELFEWNNNYPLEMLSIERARVNLRLKGSYPAIMRAHGLLETHFAGLTIREFRASWPGSLSASTDIELQLVIDLDYQQVAS